MLSYVSLVFCSDKWTPNLSFIVEMSVVAAYLRDDIEAYEAK